MEILMGKSVVIHGLSSHKTQTFNDTHVSSASTVPIDGTVELLGAEQCQSYVGDCGMIDSLHIAQAVIEKIGFRLLI